VRVIAGGLGGRTFESPHGHRTHPMSEKARGGLFNALGDIEGLTVLDAYAGSGALSFEAISRGAASSVAVDIDKGAITTIVKNISDLGLEDQVQAIRARIVAWLYRNARQQFDLVLVDPPYDAIHDRTLEKIGSRAKPGGVAVYSLPPNDRFKLPADKFEKISEKSYGDATLVFYRKIQ
jgi:16S rRNA (guanine966-N2)-methyltransferase